MRERTILVVDDEKNTRLSLGEALTPLGFNVVTAASGEEALAKLEADRPVLMLLDLASVAASVAPAISSVNTRPDDALREEV